MTDPIVAVDLFCGAGGFSEGLRQACEDLGYDLRHAAVNHWDRAVETHERNHPDAHQYQSKVEQLHPPDVVQRLTDEDSVDVDLLVGGPSCTHFSRARGGKPVNEQLRMSPWHVLHWLELLDVDAFIIENVPEIADWGPVDDDGQPVRDGSIFEAWVNSLNALGYAVDWTQLVAADYGDPTSRERFFIVGRQHGSVSFPEPTHSDEDPDLPDYRTAADIIDWSDPGQSIWTRDLTQKRVHSPPKDSTMQRIAEGIRRHCDDALAPFADVLDTLGRDEIRDLRENRAVPAAYAATAAAALDEPFLVSMLDQSATTAQCESVLLKQQDWGHPWSINDRPVPTIATRGGHALVTPSLIEPKNGRHRGIHSNPLYRPDDRPFHTVTTDPRAKLVSPTVRPFVDDYEGPPKAPTQPLGTITSRDRFALCVPELWPWGLDIKYRMLQPRELQQAQGFPESYDIAGTKADRTKQIGNAVPVNLATALCKHVLTAEDPSLATYGGGITADDEADIPDYSEVASDD
ncbi:DNA cytosine methyltransferase [Halomicroarcula sp. S1AR25-4]|uniref:DNA cytosine methyltransferase n=1 Tax=Haloarcula sp. S1AR25-4 TaxID=2950538 RepID=UPI00287432F9|nr:DNA cytosine methyltransferase [Halomicroarcula sp. S1AR25-4]MDS0280040.1 DNA cytosine methyltransferase [Halomicroarcula sp. S1AR25-4]